MPEASWSFAEVRFVDREQVLDGLRRAAREAQAAHPEIVRVLLFGSFAQGNWTADSDADLIVVVRKEFPDLLSRSRYHIHSPSVLVDTLVYSETEFDRQASDPSSFLSRVLSSAMEL